MGQILAVVLISIMYIVINEVRIRRTASNLKGLDAIERILLQEVNQAMFLIVTNHWKDKQLSSEDKMKRSSEIIKRLKEFQ
jgi:hypothetical protein